MSWPGDGLQRMSKSDVNQGLISGGRVINRSNGYCRQFSVSECSPYQLRCLQCYIILGKIIDTVEDQEDNFLIGEKEAPGQSGVTCQV